MRATRWLWCVAIVGGCLAASASAQQAVRWQVNLEAAKRLASQTNRMVLIHFWADWCQPCRDMEKEVYARPEIAAALEQSFVPVRLNADYFPHTRQQYGVTILPSDVIITPDGQLVERIVGAADPPQYLARLSQIASLDGNRPLGSYGQPESGTLLATQQPAGPLARNLDYQRPGLPGSASPDGRYAGPGDWQQVAQTAPTGPRYAGPAVPNYGAPQDTQGIKIPPATDIAGSRGPRGPAVAQGSPQSEMTAPYLADTARGEWSGHGRSQASPPTRQSPPPATVQLPPGNPPLGLDAYCPVELSDNRRWVLGDLRWGLIHRGRTYLFASPGNRDRFDADPDRYAPILSGHDVVLAVERGEMLPGSREHGAWFEDHVYLFSSEATLREFDANPQRYVYGLLELSQSTARRPAYGAPARDTTVPAAVPRDPYGPWR